MEIRDDSSSCFVRLTPVGYQFPKRSGDPYDDNWLIVEGRVQEREQAWTFQGPVMLVDEAQSVSTWLRDVAADRGIPMDVSSDDELWPALRMIEPNIGLGLVESAPESATIRIFLGLESAPPSVEREVATEYSLDLTTDLRSLELAASEWEAQLARFPYRG